MTRVSDELREAFAQMRVRDIEPRRVAIPRSAFDSLMAELGPLVPARRDPRLGILPVFEGVEIEVLEGR